MTTHSIPFDEAVRTSARVAMLSFGGPAGQIAVMHRIQVADAHSPEPCCGSFRCRFVDSARANVNNR